MIQFLIVIHNHHRKIINMLIPKIPKKQQPVKRKCLYQGCGVEFEGSRTSKYCQLHRNPQNRKKEIKIVEDVSLKNQILQHEHKTVQTIMLKCALDGCGNEFEVKLFPRQYVYPKFCPEHRNDQRRQNHIDSMKL